MVITYKSILFLLILPVKYLDCVLEARSKRAMCPEAYLTNKFPLIFSIRCSVYKIEITPPSLSTSYTVTLVIIKHFIFLKSGRKPHSNVQHKGMILEQEGKCIVSINIPVILRITIIRFLK